METAENPRDRGRVTELVLFALLIADGGILAFRTEIAAAERARVERRHAEAEEGYKRALRQALQMGPGDLPEAIALNGLGYQLQCVGRLAEAEQAYERALQIVERRLGPGDRRSLEVATNLVALYLESGRSSNAEALLRRMLTVNGRPPEDTAVLNAELASLLAARERGEEAEALYLRALSDFERDSRLEFRERTVITLSNLSTLYMRKGEAARAVEYSDRARNSLATLPHRPALLTIKTLANAAAISAQRGPDAETEHLFKSVIAFVEETYGPDHYLLGHILSNYFHYLKKSDRGREAKGVRKRAQRILDAFNRDNALGHTIDVSAFR